MTPPTIWEETDTEVSQAVPSEADYRELVAADPFPAPDVSYDRQQLRTLILMTLNQQLGPVDAEVLRSRYGLTGDDDGQTLAAIAQRLGVTKERIRLREARALRILRCRSKSLLIFVQCYVEHDRGAWR